MTILALVSKLAFAYASPVLISSWPGHARGPAQAVGISGNYAYLACDVGGLWVVDVTDPAHPNRVAGLDTTGPAKMIAVAEQYLVVAEDAPDVLGGQRLEVIDIANPIQPVSLGEWMATGVLAGIAIKSNCVFVLDTGFWFNGLTVVDISDPNVPRTIGTFGLEEDNSPDHLTVQGDYAYVSFVLLGEPFPRTIIKVIDISDPSNPQPLGGDEILSFDYVDALAVCDRYLFVAAADMIEVFEIDHPVGFIYSLTSRSLTVTAEEIWVDENRVLICGSQYVPAYRSVLQILEWNALFAGFLTEGEIGLPGWARRVIGAGNNALVACDTGGLEFIDASDVVAPKSVANLQSAGYARDVFMSNGYVYLADQEGGLQIIDVHNPKNPQLVANHQSWATTVWVSGSVAYIGGEKGLEILNISQPENPQTVYTNQIAGQILDLAVSGNKLYSASFYWGLSIMDLLDPANPTVIGNASGTCFKVAISGSYAYLAQGSSGLRVLDVFNPTAPITLGSIKPVKGNYDSVTLDGPFALTAGYRSGLQVIDVSTPTNLLIVGGCSTRGMARDVAVSGNYAYVADNDAGLLVIDVSQPTNCVAVSSCDTQGLARGIIVSGNYAYVADGPGGLAIIQVDGFSPKITQPPVDVSVLQGNTTSFKVTVAGSPPLFYQWYHDGFAVSSATNPAFQVLSAGPADQGFYTVRVSNQFGWVLSQAAECVVQAPPAILSLSDSSVQVSTGETLELKVEATGHPPPSYAWYFNEIIIPGATSSNLVMADVRPNQQGAYYALVSNVVGVVTSAVMNVSVSSPPSIATTPLAQYLTLGQLGQGISFGLGVNGTGPFAFQWQLNGQAIAGATNEDLTIKPVRLADAGAYTVVVENEAGTVVSDPVELVIEVPVLVAGDHFTNRVDLPLVMTNVIAGSNSLATVEPGEPLHGGKPSTHTMWYGWTAPGPGWVEFRTQGSSFDTVLAGYRVPSGAGTNSPFNFALLELLATDDDSGGYVERSGAGYVDEGTYFSSRIAFNVQDGEEYAVVVASFGEVSGRYLLEWEYRATSMGLPVLVIQPKDQTVPAGGTVQLSAMATNAIGYQWYFNDQPLSNAITSEWVISPAGAAAVGVYRVVVTGPGGTVLSAPAEVELGGQTSVKSYDKWEDLELVARDHNRAGRWAQGAGSSGMLLVTEGYSGQQIVGTYKATTSAGELAGALEIVTATKYLGLQMEASGALLVQAGPGITLYLYRSGIRQPIAQGSGTLRYEGVALGQLYYLSIGGSGSGQAVTLDFWVGGAPVLGGGEISHMTVPRGESFELNAPAWSGQPAVSYQWYLDGRLLPGDTQSHLARAEASGSEAGVYRVQLWNVFGSAFRDVAQVEVEVPLVMKRGVKWQGTNVVVGFEGNTGQSYQVQRSASLTNWQVRGERWMVAEGVEYTDEEAAGQNLGMYRVKEQGVSCVNLTNGYAGGDRVWEVRGGRVGRPYRLEWSADGQTWNYAGTNAVQITPYVFPSPTNRVYRALIIP